MSTTIVETPPVWVYKLFTENPNSAVQNQNIQQTILKNKQVKEQESILPIKQNLFLGRVSSDKLPNSMNNISPSLSNGCARIVNRSIECSGDSLDALKYNCEKYRKMQAGLCTYLHKLREPLANYQEKRGVPKDTEHTFIGLMNVLFQASYHAILTILTMLVNLTPLYEGFLYLFRFSLDKAIDICETDNARDQSIKCVIFVVELFMIFLVLCFMAAVIIFPILHLITYTLSKLYNMIG